MKDWDALYREHGIIQMEPAPRAVNAIKFLKQNNARRVLDLGCGTGRHTIILVNEGFDTYGCDSSEKGLEIASGVIKEAKFKQCDMTSLPYEDGFFNGIICNFVIQHGRTSDIRKAVSEMYRVLRQGGILYLTVISTDHPKSLTGEEIEPNTRINTVDIDGDIPHHFFAEKEMKELFREFKILSLKHFKGESQANPGKMMAAWELYAQKP
jgi:ubiquinone/menaquinone biosynthesis C-methylase UbiE